MKIIALFFLISYLIYLFSTVQLILDAMSNVNFISKYTAPALFSLCGIIIFSSLLAVGTLFF